MMLPLINDSNLDFSLLYQSFTLSQLDDYASLPFLSLLFDGPLVFHFKLHSLHIL